MKSTAQRRNIPLSKLTFERLKELAQKYGYTQSEMAELLINAAYRKHVELERSQEKDDSIT